MKRAEVLRSDPISSAWFWSRRHADHSPRQPSSVCFHRRGGGAQMLPGLRGSGPGFLTAGLTTSEHGGCLPLRFLFLLCNYASKLNLSQNATPAAVTLAEGCVCRLDFPTLICLQSGVLAWLKVSRGRLGRRRAQQKKELKSFLKRLENQPGGANLQAGSHQATRMGRRRWSVRSAPPRSAALPPPPCPLRPITASTKVAPAVPH